LRIPFDKLIYGFPIIKTRFPQQTVFRARKMSPAGRRQLQKYITNPFSNVEELWYPPKGRITNYGRANSIGEQVFYCSTTEACTVAEVRPDIGDVVTILECELMTENPPIVQAWGLTAFAIEEKSDGKMAAKLLNFLDGSDNLQKFKLINEYVDQEFTKIVPQGAEYKYKISIVLFELLMQKKFYDLDDGIGKSDGLAYQSIAWQSGVNLAIRPESIDRLYRPRSCRMLVIANKATDPLRFEWRLVNEARRFLDSGSIEWKWDDHREIRRY